MSENTEQDPAVTSICSLAPNMEFSKFLVELSEHDPSYRTTVEMHPMDIEIQQPHEARIPQHIARSSKQSLMEEFLGLSKDHSPDKDGPKDNQTDNHTISLKVHDGKLFMYNHGNLVKRSLVKYYHYRDQEAMTVLRLAQHLHPDLVLDNVQADQDEISLVVINEGRPPQSDRELQTISLQNKQGLNLTFHHKPPCEPNLLALSDEHLMNIIKLKSPDEKYIPQIQIRYVTSPMTPDSNNIALYFDASDGYYYYVHVGTDGRSLLLVRENKTKDPRKNFRKHLTFTQKSVNS